MASISRMMRLVRKPLLNPVHFRLLAETSPTDGVYAYRWTDLRFTDRETESRFARDHLLRALPMARVFLLAAAALYAIFGILDFYIIPEVKTISWIVRYAVVCPLLTSVALFSCWSHFHRVAQFVLALCVLAAGMGIVVMIATASQTGATLYYAGLIMVVIYGSSLISLRCGYAAAVSALLVLIYNIVAIFVNPIATHILLNNEFFLGMSLAIGIFSSYVQERQARRDFVSIEMLRREKERSDLLRDEADESNRAKSNFLAITSHELRTPLNAIIGFSEIMQLGMFGPIGSERYASYVDDIHSTGEHLLSVINDILDLSKAEVGQLVLAEQEVDIFSALSHCLRLLRDKAAENGIRMSIDPRKGSGPVMRVDPRLMKQVFLNVLANSIKFTPRGGSINVGIEGLEDDTQTIQFIDTGIGIAEKDLPRVLEPFVQVENAYDRKHGGTGLGLPIAKKIIELHGGDLAISSKLGGGTRVEIRIPPARMVYHGEAAANVA